MRTAAGGIAGRPDPASPPREVVVSFGDATLVLSDGSGLPLAHWSLPAVTRLNPGQSPARFAPDEGGSETLDIEDAEVTAAIETVTRDETGRGLLKLKSRPEVLTVSQPFMHLFRAM